MRGDGITKVAWGGLSWMSASGADQCKNMEFYENFSKEVGFFALNPHFEPQKYAFNPLVQSELACKFGSDCRGSQ